MKVPEPLLNAAQVVVCITPYQCVLSYTTKRGVVTRPVSAEALVRTVAGTQNTTYDTGWIDPRVVRSGVVNGENFLVAFTPPERRTLFLEDKAGALLPLTAPMPGLVWFGHGTRWRVAAVAERRFSTTAHLFHAPLPNIGRQGTVCWGSNTPQPAQPAAFDTTVDLFWRTPFGAHDATEKSRAHPDDVRKHLAALEGSRRFPTSDLLPMKATVASMSL